MVSQDFLKVKISFFDSYWGEKYVYLLSHDNHLQTKLKTLSLTIFSVYQKGPVSKIQ